MAFKPSVFIAGIRAHNTVTLVFNCLMSFKGDSGAKSDETMQSRCDKTDQGAGLLWKSWGFEKLPGYHSFIRLLLKDHIWSACREKNSSVVDTVKISTVTESWRLTHSCGFSAAWQVGRLLG